MTEQPPNQPPQPWQPQQQGYLHPGYPQYAPEPPATSKAVVALVLGLVGLTVCPGVASIPAWIVGQDALKEIDAANGALGGRSMALAGKVTGIVGTVFATLGLIAVILIFVIGGIFASSVGGCTSDNEGDFSFNC